MKVIESNNAYMQKAESIIITFIQPMFHRDYKNSLMYNIKEVLSYLSKRKNTPSLSLHWLNMSLENGFTHMALNKRIEKKTIKKLNKIRLKKISLSDNEYRLLGTHIGLNGSNSINSLVDDNYSYVALEDYKDGTNFSKHKIAGLISSLEEKGFIYNEDIGQNTLYVLNVDYLLEYILTEEECSMSFWDWELFRVK